MLPAQFQMLRLNVCYYKSIGNRHEFVKKYFLSGSLKLLDKKAQVEQRPTPADPLAMRNVFDKLLQSRHLMQTRVKFHKTIALESEASPGGFLSNITSRVNYLSTVMRDRALLH
jgi:hypothetical protein